MKAKAVAPPEKELEAAAEPPVKDSGPQPNVVEAPKASRLELVMVAGSAFTPKEIDIDAGQSVVWKWEDGPHSVVADDRSFDSGLHRAKGHHFVHTFEKPGNYVYHCEMRGAHGGQGMSGVVRVH